MNTSRHRGLSLIELMITLAVILVLALAGGPPLADLLRNNRLTAQANALNAALTRARGEAVARRGSVSICSSSTNASADDATDNADQWEGGWIVFVDDTNGDCKRDAAELLLAVQGALPADMTLRTTGFANPGFVRFDARGLPDSAGTFILCDARGAAHARTVAVNAVGKVVRPGDTNANGIPQLLTGGDATCP
jgi:type IV fimbrial biogenesis protein FimT